MAPKTVLITGCSTGGIGHALVLSFQRRSYTVFATARSPKKMDDMALLPNIHLLALDVTDPSSIAAAAKEVEGVTGGKLDVLVNNAGQQYIMPALDVDMDTAQALFEVNYWGPLRTMQAFSALLIAARGCVVNIGQYNASKAAIHMFSETLRLELAPLGVRVITLVAGNVASNMSAGSNGPPPSELPATSRYKAVEAHVAKQGKFSDMNTARFADEVVSAVSSGAAGKLWKGGNIMLVRWLVPFMPGFVYDRIMMSLGRGLDKMPKAL
ncbi:Acylglycerone-phosphate reductase [Ascochyta rabiei]|uniref:Acylglycerone-phosphate reductase n=1 Tax=Didymella rabiei TaxID=5454 RepID=UPI001900FB73|nr:Acylglycerone-phosphate reductase [Ascochyta rabiei]UPX14255.1 Acylglycerone-phosphate reductase [Ascochyta rabiei]